jgi:peptidoglycan/xylan/chitin deacetylase (PgdA/CDA1 family)
MKRRGFLGLAAAAATAGLWLPEIVEPVESASAASKPKYPNGVMFGLPGKTKRVAWTVDDGGGKEALHNYIDFAQETETRLTFFITSNYSPWRTLRRQLLPLVESGQVQLANHTKTHRALTKLDGAQIRRELTECGKFIQGDFGVEAAPLFRPPFGYYDKRVMREAASVGYKTCTLWYGSLGDSGNTRPKRRLELANQWMTAGHIVIAHANVPTPPADLRKIKAMLDSRNLETVTLDDVWNR